MRISLQAGLVVRHGERALELVRLLSAGEVLLEDMATRRPQTMSASELLRRIWSGKYIVVLESGGGQSGTIHPPAEAPVSLASLPDRDASIVERRLEYMKALKAAHITRGQRARVERVTKKVAERRGEKPPSASTVMLWARKYENAQFSAHALVSRNYRRRRARRLHPLLDSLITKVLREVYFTRAKHTLQHALDSIRQAARELASRGQVSLEQSYVSLSTVSRRIREVDSYHRVASRDGAARARMLCRTAFGADGATAPLQRVEVDHTILDWVVICDRTGIPLGRPTLTVIIDAYSGYLLGLYLSFYGPGVSSVSGVLRNAVMPKDQMTKGMKLEHDWLASGLPDLLIVDNGLEFHARAFKRMCWDLRADLMYCRVRTPWLKPHVERFFSTLGGLTLVRGRVRKHEANVLRIDPMKDAAITFSALVRGLVKFATDVYPFMVNERKLARPYDLFREGIERMPPVEYPGSWDEFRLSSALSKQLTVSQGGIELHGMPFGQGELLGMRRRHGKNFKTLVKWDPDDMQCVYVEDPMTGEWVTSPCRWHVYAQGLSWNQHKLIRQFARAELKLKGAEDELMRARLELDEYWRTNTAKLKRVDAKEYARTSGFTSARVLGGTPGSLAPEAVVLPPALNPMQPESIPEFETVCL